MRYAGVDFAAVDADSQHQTLSRRYPQDSAIFDATKTFDDFARMLKELPAFPAPSWISRLSRHTSRCRLRGISSCWSSLNNQPFDLRYSSLRCTNHPCH